MNAAVIYRPNSRKLTWFAFACAIAVHLTAVAIAGNQSRPPTLQTATDLSDIIGIDNPEDSPPPEEVLPPEPVLLQPNEEMFPEEISRPAIHPQKKLPVKPVFRSTSNGSAIALHTGSAKALTLYAPKPNYPYEARRGGITGTGVARLKVNYAAGNVVDAQMAQSTGSAILDNATLAALKRWRFKLGVAENVDVPITYTLSGVSY